MKIHEHKMDLQEESQILAAQAAAIQQGNSNEQKRQEEAKKAAEAALQQPLPQRPQIIPPVHGGDTTVAVPVSSGAFTQPANGRLTSGFGVRGGRMHYGVDIANRAARVPIVAAADGVVISSYYSGSYGNVVFIAHSINGQTYTTVSAHMETRYVEFRSSCNKRPGNWYYGQYR